MAHNNVPFIVARKIFEGNKADNKWNITVKNQKNFTTLSQKDAVKELSQRHFHSQKYSSSNPEPSNQQSQTTHRQRSNIYLKETGPGNVKKGKELRPLTNLLMGIPDAEVLINRIWRTAELHHQYHDGRGHQ
jgi:hypothetical protein